MTEKEFEERLESVRSRIFDVREKRIHPLKDDKVLADWNGLMAAAMAFAGRAFNEPARKATEFVFAKMRTDDGRLLHRYRDGDASIPAFLDDHVFMTAAMLELYDATFDPAFLERARQLQQQTRELFWDRKNSGFFFTADDNEELLVRQKEAYDGAIPSGNSMAADNYVRLARLTGDTEYLQGADQIFATFSSEANQLPSAHSQLISALQRGVGPSLEVVIAGVPTIPRPSSPPSGRCTCRTRRYCWCHPGRQATPCAGSLPSPRVTSRSTAEPPPTSAATSPASCRPPNPRSSGSCWKKRSPSPDPLAETWILDPRCSILDQAKP
jgi:uncharacterized protein YyaL (SSP411 family)